MLQKLPQKRVPQKTAEAAGDLIGNKIVDKITSVGKSKEDDETQKILRKYIQKIHRKQKILMS